MRRIALCDEDDGLAARGRGLQMSSQGDQRLEACAQPVFRRDRDLAVAHQSAQDGPEYVLVSRELGMKASSSAGADERGPIGRAHPVDDRRGHTSGALPMPGRRREIRIVQRDDDETSGRMLRVVGEPGAGVAGRLAGTVRRRILHLYRLEPDDVHGLAVFVDLHFMSGEVHDGLAVGVCRDHVDGHDVDARTEHLLRLPRRRRDRHHDGDTREGATRARGRRAVHAFHHAVLRSEGPSVARATASVGGVGRGSAAGGEESSRGQGSAVNEAPTDRPSSGEAAPGCYNPRPDARPSAHDR